MSNPHLTPEPEAKQDPSPTDVTVFKQANDIASGDVLVGAADGRALVVEDAKPDSLLAGFTTIWTEHGTLLLDPDDEEGYEVVPG